MSGATIGGVVGGVIGAYFGNPQLGYMIGSAIGGYVDPERVEGPRLTDATQQTAQDGVPRAYGYGRFPTTGNLIWTDELKERRNKQRAKGGSTEQVTYTYTRSYAIAVCRGPISGFLIVKRNGKIVFDARTDAELTALGFTSNQIAESRAAQAKFLQHVTLYYGGTDQTPDPTITAVKGAGNVPGYIGTAYIVVTDDDLTEVRGAVPQYEFVVAVCGERHDDQTSPQRILISGSPKETGGPALCYLDTSQGMTFHAIPQSSGANISGGVPAFYDGTWAVVNQTGVRYATSLGGPWSSGTISADGTVNDLIAVGGGWLAMAGDSRSVVLSKLHWSAGGSFDFAEMSPINDPDKPVPPGGGSPGGPTFEMYRLYSLGDTYYGIYYTAQYTTKSPGSNRWEVNVPNFDRETVSDIARVNGVYWGACGGGSSGSSSLRWSEDGKSWPGANVVTLPSGAGRSTQLLSVDMLDGTQELIAYTESGRFVTSADNFAAVYDIGIGGPNASPNHQSRTTGARRMVAAGGLVYFIGYQTGGDKLVVFNPATLEISSPYTMPISSAKGIAISTLESFGTPIPDAPGYFIDPQTGEIVGPPGITIDPCTPTNGSIVAAQCNSRGVSSIDVSDLTDNVVGFRIASTSSPQKNIGALMPGYNFDASEFDGLLHFPKRGGADSFDLTYDDLVERDGDPLQWERTQEPELLRKVTVGYMDPATSFSATTQQWERRAGTVKAEGEGTLQLPIVGTGDWAAQVCEKTGKIAWGESDKCTFHVSIQHAELVTAAVGTITDENGTKHRVRIERIEDEGLVRMIEARRTSPALYQSTASGAQKPLPQYPGSGIHGPTISAVLNMPAILDSDDRPGVYWAASGYFPNWAGAQLQVQRAGTWTPLGTILGPSSIGTLASYLPAHHGDLDMVNTLHIRINDELENITFLQLLSERNAVAIQYPDSTVEVVQFQSVEVDPDGNYLCTKLIRGNLNTVRGDHAAGATVVFIDQTMQFVDLRPDDLGRTLSFRVVGLGTDPDTSVPFDITFDRIWSSTEWPVAMFDVVKDGDDYQLTWMERRRLGSDVDPIRSANWQGYAVSYAYSGIANQVTVTDPFHTFTLPGASDVDFTVAQLNRLTGEGPASEVNVP